MTLLKSAQQTLFMELAKSDIEPLQSPVYNGYGINDFGEFQNLLNNLYENFERELNDNLTNRHPSLKLYLTDITKTLSEISVQVRQYQQEEIYDSNKDNPDLFKLNQLGYMNNFMNFQLEIIDKTKKEIGKKLELVENPELFKPEGSYATETGTSVMDNKIRFKLSKIDLTVLLWWLAESEILPFETHDNFVKFTQDNFQYFDKKHGIFTDMKDIGSLMSKLNDNYSSEDPKKSCNKLLEKLQKTTLPPNESKLKKQKWSR